MTKHGIAPAKSHDFTVAFEQMCSMVAIAQTRNASETLRELLIQCFVILPDEPFENAHQLAQVIETLFGLQIPEHEIQIALEILLKDGTVNRQSNSKLTLRLDVRAERQERVDYALSLESRVRTTWLEEIRLAFPSIPANQLQEFWAALRNYLAKAFCRHGIQATALLDPTVEISEEYSRSLSSLLDEVIRTAHTEHQTSARSAISSFLAGAGKSADRAKYIAQLADGAFNYFSLSVKPDVAEQFREKLNPLKLFLDTNFLYGILDLTVNSQVDISNELLAAISKHNLPFSLLYHEITERELQASIAHYEQQLQNYNWSRPISRAASTSRYLSGVELKYHQRYAETGIDVVTFFGPYKHSDVVLQGKNIAQYQSDENRLEERATLIAEYQAYLELRRKEKGYARRKSDEMIDHDATLLDTVRKMRSTAESTLHAGALLITCDYTLYAFDWGNCRQHHVLPCTVLPNLLWQILRPFVPPDADFDRVFAETFAIPEFRIIGSGATEACAKMLHILASYKNFPEDTARRMVSNDLLIKRLETVRQNDPKFLEYIEQAVAQENAMLLEEKLALTAQLEQAITARQLQEVQIKEKEEEHKKDLADRDRAMREKQQELESVTENALQAGDQARRANELAAQTLASAESIKVKLAQAETEKKRTENIANAYRILLGVVLGVIVTILFEVAIYFLPCTWVINHPNSYGIQLAIILLLNFFIMGLFLPILRKWFWGSSGAITIVIALTNLLGGPPP